ncbi:transcription antitermination factor NusB [Pseudogracilibacillus sp. SE30717A]|uniref:transcription antitermination factor NusB n=1 Tax=Pseudogracilibacillus sp. SE30717A TaxID=3098293 RepID=UPI00300E2CC8
MDRRSAREEAFKILFQEDINSDIEINDKGMNSYTKIVVFGTIKNKQEIDHRISSHLHNWSFERIPLVEKAILRIAVYEMDYLDDIPIGVSINEAVELAHKYGDEKSGKFINGVLSNIIK